MPQFRPLPDFEGPRKEKTSEGLLIEASTFKFRHSPELGLIDEEEQTEEHFFEVGVVDNSDAFPFFAPHTNDLEYTTDPFSLFPQNTPGFGGNGESDTDAFSFFTPHTNGLENPTGALHASPQNTTGHMRVLLLSSPNTTSVTDQLSSFVSKSTAIDQSSPLVDVLKATMSVPTSTSRLTVIHADKKLQIKKSAKTTSTVTRRLKLHTRQAIVLLATLIITIGTLLSLVPLAAEQGNGGFLGGIGDLIHSAQIGWQIQAHQNMSAAPKPGIPVNGNLPPMTIPNSPYVATAQQDAINAGIPPVYFVRQINQESGFNPDAVSVTDAEGIAQFEPGTAAGLGINPWDPIQALRGAAQLMANYYHLYGDYGKALAAYNAGPANLQAAENACGINWLGCLPGQTQNYVYVIIGE